MLKLPERQFTNDRINGSRAMFRNHQLRQEAVESGKMKWEDNVEGHRGFIEISGGKEGENGATLKHRVGLP